MFHTIWEFITNLFSPAIGKYEYLPIDERSFALIKFLLLGVFLGIVLASTSALYNKRYLGKFIRALLRAEATSKETAKTVAELGFAKKALVKYSLSRGVTLRKSVSCVEADEARAVLAEKLRPEVAAALGASAQAHGKDAPTDEQIDRETARRVALSKIRPDAETGHFYIPEEEKYRIDIKFDAKGTNLVIFVLTIVLSAVVLGLLIRFLPDFLAFLDWLIGVIL